MNTFIAFSYAYTWGILVVAAWVLPAGVLATAHRTCSDLTLVPAGIPGCSQQHTNPLPTPPTGVHPTGRQAFWRDGYALLENAVSAAQLAALRADLHAWIETSRGYDRAYGAMSDGRPRFDLESSHSAAQPALRRVSSPTEISAASLQAVRESAATAAAAALIGPDVRFHHAKYNSKLPRSGTTVKWHQDFPFEPHSNDDIVTTLIFLDDLTEENGPLRLVPGSHRGPLYSHWHDGVFTGAVDAEVAASFERAAVRCTGVAGSACLMHSRVAHASSANHSAAARTLFIYTLSAADAVPLSPNPLPSTHAGMIVAGREPGVVRCSPYRMPLPEVPQGASFFVQQAQRAD